MRDSGAIPRGAVATAWNSSFAHGVALQTKSNKTVGHSDGCPELLKRVFKRLDRRVEYENRPADGANVGGLHEHFGDTFAPRTFLTQ